MEATASHCAYLTAHKENTVEEENLIQTNQTRLTAVDKAVQRLIN